tara:strand:+ start:949 stop:1641 length:693 start_codon:yes stop_codon:yes gene_type:complete
MPTTSVGFTKDTLKFLRALKRHNERDWFNAHKANYEAHVKAPMLAIIKRLATDFPQIAPDLVASPRSMYRIYRDTRFSPDKTPYKTHVSAAFSHQRLLKNESAGLYFHLSPTELWIGGGLYAPQTPQLHRIREHIVANLQRFGSLAESPAVKRLGGVRGERLQRVPRGFPKDHKAADYLRLKQYLIGDQLDAEKALSPRFYDMLVRRFTTIAPFIHFLNAPLAAAAPFRH